jgi:hypothetical protein
MAVPMRMRFGKRPIVSMLMVLVMHVCMFVFQCFMVVLVRMTLGYVKIQACGHQGACHEQPKGQRLTDQHNGQECADEGREGVVSAGASRTKVTQGQDEHQGGR